jgi:hypothetical protein
MNLFLKYKMCCQLDMTRVGIAFLAIILMMVPDIAQASHHYKHQLPIKFYNQANTDSLATLRQVNHRYTRPKPYRYGDHYRIYKKKYQSNKNHIANYDYSPHYSNHQQRQYHTNSGFSSYGHKNIQRHKPLRQYRRHYGFETSYWSAHKRHGYRHQRIARNHYYYDDRGFYFPGLGRVAHDHRHNSRCEGWHFSALRATSVLLHIYNK